MGHRTTVAQGHGLGEKIQGLGVDVNGQFDFTNLPEHLRFYCVKLLCLTRVARPAAPEAIPKLKGLAAVEAQFRCTAGRIIKFPAGTHLIVGFDGLLFFLQIFVGPTEVVVGFVQPLAQANEVLQVACRGLVILRFEFDQCEGKQIITIAG